MRRARFARVRALLRLLLDPMAIMLVVAATVYFALGETRDALVLALALVPVLGVDVALEARSHAALEKLAQAAAPLAEVVRDGQLTTTALEDVVPGDLVAFGEGDVIPADAVVQWAANLAVDESSLTGESEPQLKCASSSESEQATRDSLVFAGSVVRAGHGFGRVVTTGTATKYGGIAALVARTDPERSPLQKQVGWLVQRLGLVAFAVAAAIFALILARGASLAEAVIGAVSIAMAAVPEEFPLVLTLFLSVGAWRLAARGMLVRRLASVETLGSTSVICVDKTGTLTHGLFELASHVVVDAALSEREFIEAAVLACEVHPVDAMERAIVAYAEQRAITPSSVHHRRTQVRDYDFDPVGKHMSHVWQLADADRDGFLVVAKGALEGVLAHCRSDPALLQATLAANDRLAGQGMRVLAVARKRVARAGAGRDEDERDLSICGLLGFHDPLRVEVPAAVSDCQRAGVHIKIVTGDHALTAHAAAHSAGIVHDDSEIVLGEELEALGDERRAACIERSAIFARISPHQKFLIVDALKRRGAIVAMTGDGVNDAPALRRADIGVAMGVRGTDVARATADLVLLDDNFASIVATIREGRHILDNIRRAFLYLIAFHVPIVALAVLAPLAGVPLILLPVHLVWLELIVHPVSALVFQAEPPAPDLMERPPRDPAAPLLGRTQVIRSVLSGGILAAAAFAVYGWRLSSDGEPAARALALIVLVSGYQVLVIVERVAFSPRASLLPRTVWFWAVWLATAASAAVAIAVPPVAGLFRTELPARPLVWIALATGCAAVAWRLSPRARLP